MFCTLTPSAMMSNTAIASPASPAQASDVALPPSPWRAYLADAPSAITPVRNTRDDTPNRSEEHTSELQSQSNLVCRLLLEKKKKKKLTPRLEHRHINTARQPHGIKAPTRYTTRASMCHGVSTPHYRSYCTTQICATVYECV